MPIYRYRCPEHGEVEKLLPVRERDTPQHCGCGRGLIRLMTAASFKVAFNTRDTVLDTLNREHRGKPTQETMLIAEGLKTPRRPVIGTGF